MTWGNQEEGGDSSQVQEQLRNVQHIQATGGAFAAILESGAVVPWGNQEEGGDSSQVQEQLRNVQHIQATGGAFAAILESDAVVTWGRPEYGGDSSQVQEQLKNVQHVQATMGAFAAILKSGAVVTWGNQEEGGDSSQAQEQLRNVQQIQSTSGPLRGAFAAILQTGDVAAWSHAEFGGDSSQIRRLSLLKKFVRLLLLGCQSLSARHSKPSSQRLCKQTQSRFNKLICETAFHGHVSCTQRAAYARGVTQRIPGPAAAQVSLVKAACTKFSRETPARVLPSLQRLASSPCPRPCVVSTKKPYKTGPRSASPSITSVARIIC